MSVKPFFASEKKLANLLKSKYFFFTFVVGTTTNALILVSVNLSTINSSRIIVGNIFSKEASEKEYTLTKELLSLENSGIISCIELIEPKNNSILFSTLFKKRCNLMLNQTNGSFISLNGKSWKLSYKVPFSNLTLFYLLIFQILILLLSLISSWGLQNTQNKKHEIKKIKDQSLYNLINLSKQVAHDIRSPLSALNMITSSLDEVSKEKRELIKSSIQRINEIANDLLRKGKDDQQKLEVNLPVFVEKHSVLLAPIISSIISEKRIQFENLLNINITFDMESSFGIFCDINEAELKRVLSNLINNSIEAIKNRSGRVFLKISKSNDFAIIAIEDNGPGIPRQILDKLGSEAISYGKENTESGNGLGILHAKQTIEKFNGVFEISSQLTKGTIVSISIPITTPPLWFLDRIEINENSILILCDNDISNHSLWREKTAELTFDTLFFSSPNTLNNWLISNREVNFLLLIDYEFSNSNENGLDFIISNNLNSKSILVTSHYDEEIVIRTCTDHGIKQIPKNICALVPIKMTSAKSIYDAVVLDNEDLQVRSWQFAAIQKGKTILVFSKHEDFLAALSDIDHKTPIFIDSILGDNIKGEDIAKQVFDQGFKNVYMSSGHDPSYFKDMTFLKGVIGKTPFFP